MSKRQRRRQLAYLRLLAAILATVVVTTALGEPRQSSKSKNYILRRQEAYQVQGVPTSRIIVGRREIDVYPNGLMFEGDNLVGVRKGR